MAELRYEMLWDCPACDTPKLLGLTHRHCPNCGAAQDPNRRYYPKDDERVAVEGHPYQGVDRACPACDTPNAAQAHFCVNCGSDLDGAKAVAARAQQSDKGKSGFDEDSAKAARDEALARRQAERAPAPPPPRPSGLGLGVILAGLAGLVLCAGLAVFLFWKKDADFTVVGHRWERAIPVEELGPVQETAWKDQVPADARDLRCAQAERSTREVPDGEDCHQVRRDNGDGTFTQAEECTPRTRKEPVYDDRCDFTVDRWHEVRTERAAGEALSPAPSWPAVSLAPGREREGSRRETYTVRVRDPEGEEHGCDLEASRWSGMAVGSGWSGKIGVVSGAVDCDSLVAR